MMLSRLTKIDATRFPIELTPSRSFDLNDFDDQLFSSVDLLHKTTNRPERGLLITLAFFRESPLAAAHPWALSFEACASRSRSVRRRLKCGRPTVDEGVESSLLVLTGPYRWHQAITRSRRRTNRGRARAMFGRICIPRAWFEFVRPRPP